MDVEKSANNDFQEQKEELRKEMRSRRSVMGLAEVEAYSAVICRRLQQLKAIEAARSIMGFSAIGEEIRLMPFLVEEQKKGKTILLPRVEPQGGLCAVKYRGPGHTRPGPFGIAEPVGDPYPPDHIDAVIVPGLAFDYQGYRIGYGRGYYDRFLPHLPAATFLCGVCYDFQIVEDIHPHRGDIPVHWIITERSELLVKWDYFDRGF